MAKKIRRICWLLTLILMTRWAYSQNYSTYLGLKMGMKIDRGEMDIPTAAFHYGPEAMPQILGLDLRHSLKNGIRLETGILVMGHYAPIIINEAIKPHALNLIYNNGTFISVPLVAAYPLQFCRQRLSISAGLGIVLSTKIGGGLAGGQVYGLVYNPSPTSPTRVEYAMTVHAYPKPALKLNPLVECAVEWKFRNQMKVILEPALRFGTSNWLEGYIDYSVGQDFYTGSVKSKGSMFQIMAGIQYPISRIWQGKLVADGGGQ
jgi:hypothetical protein